MSAAPTSTKHLTLLLLHDAANARVLLGLKLRGFGAGKWNGFGGTIEPGETVCASRPWQRVMTSDARAAYVVGTSVTDGTVLAFSRARGTTARVRYVYRTRLSVRVGAVEVGVSARNLTDARWQDGVFNFASNFAEGTTASLVPARHFTAGRPLTVLASVTLHL